jgi:hypothetical protein
MGKKDSVAKAVKLVIESGHYCHQWIATSDLERILKHEFEIGGAVDFGKSVVGAIKSSVLFESAGDKFAANNMYRRNHKPKGSSRVINYVYFLHPNEGERVLPTNDWRPHSITLDDSPLCGTSELEKNHFSSAVLPMEKLFSDVLPKNTQQPDASAEEQMCPSTSAPTSVLDQASITPSNLQDGGRQKRKRLSNDGDGTAESTATSLATSAPPRTPSLEKPPALKKRRDNVTATATPTTAAIEARSIKCKNKSYAELIAAEKANSGCIPLNVASSPVTNVTSQRRKQAKDIGFILASLHDGDPEVMATVLAALLSRGEMAEVKTRLKEKMVENETRIEAGIVKGIKTFFAHHHIKGGTRVVAVQNAVDAVLGAVTFGTEEGDSSLAHISDALGVRRKTLGVAKKTLTGSYLMASSMWLRPEKKGVTVFAKMRNWQSTGSATRKTHLLSTPTRTFLECYLILSKMRK